MEVILKFKKGDRVVIIEEGNEYGKLSTIKSVRSDSTEYSIILDQENDKLNYGLYKPEHIKHHRVTYTKLAEKMYPKGKRDGKYWILQ